MLGRAWSGWAGALRLATGASSRHSATPPARTRARGAWRVVRLRRGARASRLRRGRQAQARLAADRPRGGHRHSARPAPREAGEKRRLQHLAWDYDAKADPYGDDDYVSARARRRRGRRGVIVYVRASAAAPRPPNHEPEDGRCLTAAGM